MPAQPAQRIACLAIPSLAFKCELAERPRLAGAPVALGDESHSRVADLTRDELRRPLRRLPRTAPRAGLALSMALTRFLRAWLFGVSATDPVLYSAAVIVVIGLALLAAWAPARRAARLNPVTALRCE